MISSKGCYEQVSDEEGWRWGRDLAGPGKRSTKRHDRGGREIACEVEFADYYIG